MADSLWDDSWQQQAAAANAGIQLLDSALSYKSSRDANKANVAMNEATNAANLAIAQYNNQAMIDLWREQAYYNSPVNQYRLWREAGFSPGAMLGSSGMSKAGEIPNLQSAQMHPGHVNPMDFGQSRLSNIAQNMLNLSAARKNMTESREAEVRTDFAKQHNPQIVEGAGYENRIKSKDADFAEDTYLKRLATVDGTFEMLQKDLENADIRNAANKLEYEVNYLFKEQTARANYNYIIARTCEASSQEDLNDAMRDFYRANRKYVLDKNSREQLTSQFYNMWLDKQAELFGQQSRKTSYEGTSAMYKSWSDGLAYGDYSAYHAEMARLHFESEEAAVATARQAVQMARKQNKYYDVNQVISNVKDLFSIYTQMGNLDANRMTARAYNERMSQLKREYDEKANNPYTQVYYDYIDGYGWRQSRMTRSRMETPGYSPNAVNTPPPPPGM